MIGPEYTYRAEADLAAARDRIVQLEAELVARDGNREGELVWLRAYNSKLQSKNARLRHATRNLQEQVLNLKAKQRRLQAERDAFRVGDFTIALDDQRALYDNVVEGLMSRVESLTAALEQERAGISTQE